MQFQFHHQRYELKFKLGFLLFCALIISLCCFLGNWQLHRYHFKKNLLQTYEQNKLKPPLTLAQYNATPQATQFQKIVVTGNYVTQQTVLLQNKPYKEQLGYEVITPLKMAGEKSQLLVDRGWVAQGNENSGSVLHTLGDTEKITGAVKLLNEHQFILGKNILDATRKPMLMQKLDIDELSGLTGQSYFPFVLRLSADAPEGFVRDWVITAVQPERHLGYAFQWFAMALALLIAYFCFCCERIKREPDAH
jgi:surfeit locus 1 family protein